MTLEQKNEFIRRINSISRDDKAKFGKMNVFQMTAHCADQIRMALGEIKGLHLENVDMVKIREMDARGESVPTVDGLDQIAGQGTKPTDLESDKKILVDFIEKFVNCGDDYPFHFHPFMGPVDKEKWHRLISHHLNHHLNQFGR